MRPGACGAVDEGLGLGDAGFLVDPDATDHGRVDGLVVADAGAQARAKSKPKGSNKKGGGAGPPATVASLVLGAAAASGIPEGAPRKQARLRAATRTAEMLILAMFYKGFREMVRFSWKR